MKKIIFIAGAFFFLSTSCSKDSKGCWMPFSPFGVDDANEPTCDISRKEAEEKFAGKWFYRYPETKYCWRADKPGNSSYPQYLFGIPESMKGNMEATYGYTLTKIDCSSFCRIKWLEKHKSKITGNFGPVLLYVETLVNADSCSRLTTGRVITIRETTDSLITREVSEKKP